MHIPAYSLTCVNGIATSIVPAGRPYNFEEQFSWSLGYTKLFDPTEGAIDHYLAERYEGDSRVNQAGVTFTRADDGASVDVSFATASRLAGNERKGNYVLSGYDAPFIWTNFRERISCDGSHAATVAYNDFPTTVIYVNGKRAPHGYDGQGGDFASFLKQGGTILNGDGYGPLAEPCKVFKSGTGVPWDPYTLCLTSPGGGFGGFGGGEFGGGGASGSW